MQVPRECWARQGLLVAERWGLLPDLGGQWLGNVMLQRRQLSQFTMAVPKAEPSTFDLTSKHWAFSYRWQNFSSILPRQWGYLCTDTK